MSELQFPKDPIIGQQYDFPPYKYYWDGIKWKTIGIGYNPVNDLRDELEPRIETSEKNIEDLSAQSFEALRRSYAEAGYSMVDGSFEEGGTLASISDVLLHKASGIAYSWSGVFPKVVTAGATPATTGGIGAGAWVDRTEDTLRGELSSQLGASLIGAFSSITALRGAFGVYDGQKVNVLSYNDGYYATVTDSPVGGGTFHWVASSNAADDGVRVIAPVGLSVGRWYRKIYGYVTPEMGGSKGGNSAYDDGIGIQRCLDLKKYPVQLSGIKYYVDAPLKMYSESVIFTNGNAANSATISKIGTTIGSGTALSRSGTKTDNYAINSIINIIHADNTYAYNVKISNIILEGLNHTTNYGIFAPRCSKLTLENVYILNCQNGYYTYDTWLSKFKSVYCDATTISTSAAPYLSVGPTAYGWTSTTYGFRWVDDGSGNATGTTCHFDNCWALNVHNGYDIFGLQYSVMNACAADHISNCSYSIRSSRITMNGCGTEDVYGSGGILYFASSKVTLNNFAAYKINGANSNHAALEMDGSTCSVIMNNCEIPDFQTINSAYNVIIQNGAKLSTTFASLPTNGNTFISYSSGASRIDISGDVITMTDRSGARYSKGRIRDNDVVEANNKTVATGGTVIATFTVPSSTAIYYGTIDIDLSWFDSTYPTAGGISKLQAVVYADGGTTFNQSLNTSVNIGAGNGFTTTPSFTLTRSGFVWSLTMTPAHGAIIVRTITMKLDNGNGVTVSAP